MIIQIGKIAEPTNHHTIIIGGLSVYYMEFFLISMKILLKISGTLDNKIDDNDHIRYIFNRKFRAANYIKQYNIC
jgi:hypothetical protein